MKYTSIILVVLLLVGIYLVFRQKPPFTVQDFHSVKDFVLNNGDTETYRNMDNDNPHYRFTEVAMDVYLNPAQGIHNEITIRHESQYFDIRLNPNGTKLSFTGTMPTTQGYAAFMYIRDQIKVLHKQ